MIRDFIHALGEIFEDLLSEWETWFFLILFGLIPFFVIISSSSNQVLYRFIRFLELTWWFWIFWILFPFARSLFLYWRQELFKNSIEWMLLELKVPRQIEKSSQAMEQVLDALHSLRNSPGTIKEKYWDGEITRWFSLEIVSFGGEIHFYIRAYKKLKRLIEVAFFSYYPDIDIIEVPDYINELPSNISELKEKGLDLFGTEMILSKEEAYPIKTYADFENETEEKNFDPLSTFLEFLARLKKDEFAALQILIAPADLKEWKEKWEPLVEKLRKATPLSIGETKEAAPGFSFRSPGQTETLKAVEKNLSKPAFETLIRVLFIAPEENFDTAYARKNLMGSFNQYTALNLNSFKANADITPLATMWKKPYLFAKKRIMYRKERLLLNYKKREMPPPLNIAKLWTSSFFYSNFSSKTFKMSTECLATLFHLPTAILMTEPFIRHLESRRVGPPAGLNIFGEEEEIKKFYQPHHG